MVKNVLEQIMESVLAEGRGDADGTTSPPVYIYIISFYFNNSFIRLAPLTTEFEWHPLANCALLMELVNA